MTIDAREPEQAESRSARIDAVIGYLALLILQVKLLWGARDSWDLRLWDGSWYFGWGRDIATSLSFPSFENAPFYCAYYALFHLFSGDPFVVYFAHRLTALLLIGALLYYFLYRLFSIPVALLLSAYFLLLIGDGGYADYAVRSFVVIPLLGACLFALRRGAAADLGLFFCLLLAALTRPEFGVAFPVALVAILAHRRMSGGGEVFSWRALRFRQREPALRALTVVMAVLVSVYLLAKLGEGSERSWLAFGQHFSVGQVERNRETAVDPWLHWQKYLKESFGNARGIGAALANNPSAFMEHVFHNLRKLPAVIDRAVKPAHQVQPLAGYILYHLNGFYLLLCALLAALLTFLPRHAGLRPRALDEGRVWIVLLCGLAPGLVASLVIRPQHHLLFFPAVVALCVFGAVLQMAVSRYLRKVRPLWVVVPVFATLMLTMPAPFLPPRPREVLPAVRALPDVAGEAPYGLIADSAISFCNYSDPDRCRPLEVLWRNDLPADVGRYIDETNTRILMLSPRFFDNVRPDWAPFLFAVAHDPQGKGWRHVKTTPLFSVYARVR